MNRSGKVVKIKDGQATVELVRNPACGDCCACAMGDDLKQIHITATNSVSAEIDDFVEVSMETDSVLKAAFLVYMIPLFALALGIVGGKYLLTAMGVQSFTDLYAGLLGFGLMVLAFLYVKRRDDQLATDSDYLPKIVRKVDGPLSCDAFKVEKH